MRARIREVAALERHGTPSGFWGSRRMLAMQHAAAVVVRGPRSEERERRNKWLSKPKLPDGPWNESLELSRWGGYSLSPHSDMAGQHVMGRLSASGHSPN